jgi:hypothetical protein
MTEAQAPYTTVEALTYDELSHLTAEVNKASYRRRLAEAELSLARGLEDAAEATLDAYRARAMKAVAE